MLTLALLTPTVFATSDDNDNMWAVIICGYPEFQRSTNIMYRILSEDYHFTEILYLTPDINKTTVRWAIRDWLGERSNSDDLIFILIHSHGGGAFYDGSKNMSVLEGGRWEMDSDEGDEYAETELGTLVWIPFTLKYRIEPIDFNNNSVIEDDVYAGVDECIGLQADYNASPPVFEEYWDDELAEDLDTLDYGKLVLFYEGCKAINGTTSNATCFSGGFIRDLSAPNRIIMTSSNETSYSWGYGWNDPELGYQLIAGFVDWFTASLDPDCFLSFADTDSNGLVSMGEAWDFACKHCPLVLGTWEEYLGEMVLIQETPWRDDDGDGVPNHSDGALSNETFFVSDELKLCDVNDDGVVDISDLVIIAIAFGSQPVDDPDTSWDETENWNPIADLNGDGIVDIVDIILVALYF
jgi:hypothetical protein